MKKEISLADYLLDEEEFSQEIYKENNMGDKNLDYNAEYYGEEDSKKNPLFVHYGASHLDEVKPIENDAVINKPRGGLWGSRINDDYGWHAWNIGEQYMDCRPENKILFRLKPTAKTLVIDSNEKILQILKDNELPKSLTAEKMGVPLEFINLLVRAEGMIDYEKLAKDYDAIVVNFDDSYEMRVNLEFWDCNSIVVFNKDAIEEVKQRDIYEKDMYKFIRRNPGEKDDHWEVVLDEEKVNPATLEKPDMIPESINGIPVKIPSTLLIKCKPELSMPKRSEGIVIEDFKEQER